MKTLYKSLSAIVATITFAQSQDSLAQVSVGFNTPADSSSVLEIRSANKGLLIPRLTMAERNAILLPANSLLIYQTDNKPGYYYYDAPATKWQTVGAWIVDNDNIVSANTENVGIGVNIPLAKLDVRANSNNTSIYGFSPAGVGIHGNTSTGIGGYFTSGFTNGTALMTGDGRVLLGGSVLVGGGTVTEKLNVNGAIKIANSDDPNAATDGTVRYVPGAGFQGKHNNVWMALGSGGNTYTAGNGININSSNVVSAVDQSETNELQYLSLSGNQLSISGVQANPITLPNGITLPYNGSGTSSQGPLFSVTHNGSTSAIEGVNLHGHAITGTTQNGTALRAVATHGGSGLWAQTYTGDAGTFISSAGNAILAYSGGTGTAGSFGAASTGVALHAEGTIKLKANGAANGKFLMATDSDGTIEWVNAPGGGSGGSSPWTVAGNDIHNSNSGKVLVGTTTSTTNGIMEVTANNANGKVASFYNSGAAYMSVLNATENGLSGNPAGCDGCVGSKAINASSTYGDALFARSSNGRGIYLKGGSGMYPAMLIETNATATNALEMTGRIKIADGTQGAGKVLTSDANGVATWQTVSGGGAGGGGNLDAAYDFGGAGAGRSITADNGSVNIVGTDGILVTGNYGAGANIEMNSSSSRMFFNPRKAAFRAGTVNGTEWDNTNVGDYSVAMGNGTRANGWGGTAFGSFTTAHGTNSSAFGTSTSAIGSSSTTSGDYATAYGNVATAIGHSVNSPSYAEATFGAYSTNYTPVSATSWDANDRIFTIGNGTSNFTRSNALVIFKNGNATLSGTLTQSSDKRLKRNVVRLTNSLEKITQLNGYHYQWNENLNKGNDLQTGLIAQEVETLFPELVSTDNNGMKSVAYQNLVPVLVEAIKELKRENEGLKSSNEELNERTASIEQKLSHIEGMLNAQQHFSKK